MKKIVVLGIGNILLKDEGIGIRVIEELQKEKFPPQVEIIDGGTGGLNLLSNIDRADVMIVVDCVQGGGEPGDIYEFKPEDIDKQNSGWAIKSLHDIGFLDVLNMSSFMNKKEGPETIIFGVEPLEIESGIGLNEVVEKKIPRLKELVREEIDKHLKKEGK
ncbi:MAG: HyaD/HybD family hydrogenase maturation endopeptidase [Actinomycetia bacterium]|nr:HyaD/HybD family hydrogenase maturation endopeptidase [Actinomycetes bacterium]